jgi:hypothetical protein
VGGKRSVPSSYKNFQRVPTLRSMFQKVLGNSKDFYVATAKKAFRQPTALVVEHKEAYGWGTAFSGLSPSASTICASTPIQ